MNASNLIRQFHRWMSATFVVATLITWTALAMKSPIAWIVYLPLGPLALLAITGIYMFFRPYVARRRGGRQVQQA